MKQKKASRAERAAKRRQDAAENALQKGQYRYADVLVALAALLIMPLYLYGQRVAWMALTAAAAALVTEFVCGWARGQGGIPKGDRSGLVTALVVTALMPATAPYWMAAFAVVFGLLVAKHPFGGTGKNIFNPAAAGVAFCTICWPDVMTRYPLPLSTWDGAALQYVSSPASILRVGGTPQIDPVDILLGKFAGPQGATCMVVLAACLLYLLLRRKLSFLVTSSAFLVVALAAAFWARTTTGQVNSLIYEFASGALVFGVIFMANDPTTMPDTKSGRLLYGVLIGLFTVIMRRYGAMELEFVYVILLANIFAYSCDRYAGSLRRHWRALLRWGRGRRESAGTEHTGPSDTPEEADPSGTAGNGAAAGEVPADAGPLTDAQKEAGAHA